ncbi:YhcH/YjgK/YiaL family protein [Paenibacillus sp. GYB004]|uniref:YhcH/YjgK/YiaL family protein n=1 Tax=Paenibacillus sp. GYB004 TaxID=2994393 RepID=UPI002F96D978
MIWGHIDNWEAEKAMWPAALQQAMEHIRSLDFDQVPDGKYELNGRRMHTSIKTTTTRAAADQKAESHRTYIDIQYVISGEEKIGVVPWSSSLQIARDDLDTRDVAFYDKVEQELWLHQKPGMYAVFFPADVHRPCCSVDREGPVRRMVIKIDRRLLVGEEK